MVVKLLGEDAPVLEANLEYFRVWHLGDSDEIKKALDKSVLVFWRFHHR